MAQAGWNSAYVTVSHTNILHKIQSTEAKPTIVAVLAGLLVLYQPVTMTSCQKCIWGLTV